VGVIIVVLAIEFLSTVFSGTRTNLLEYGAGIALPVAALSLFPGVRHRFGINHQSRKSIEPHSFGDNFVIHHTDNEEAHNK